MEQEEMLEWYEIVLGEYMCLVGESTAAQEIHVLRTRRIYLFLFHAINISLVICTVGTYVQ